MTTPTDPTPPSTPPPPTPMTWPQVCARRPGRHGLSARWPVVRRRSVSAVAGTHAQVRSAARAVHLPPAAELPAWTAAPSAALMTDGPRRNQYA